MHRKSWGSGAFLLPLGMQSRGSGPVPGSLVLTLIFPFISASHQQLFCVLQGTGHTLGRWETLSKFLAA